MNSPEHLLASGKCCQIFFLLQHKNLSIANANSSEGEISELVNSKMLIPIDSLCISSSYLTEEINKMAERIKQTRPLVEEVAASIRQLIQKTGLEKPD